MVLIDRKERRLILTHLFKEGVLTVAKDPRKDKHDDITEVRNLKVYMVCRSLTSKGYLMEKFNWQWHYYFLTNEGIEYLREVLHLPPQVFPSTLTKQRATKPVFAGADTAAPAGG